MGIRFFINIGFYLSPHKKHSILKKGILIIRIFFGGIYINISSFLIIK